MQQENKITISSEDVLSVKQAAHELGKHVATIYRWHDAGTILGVKFGGILFIPKSEIERIQNANHREESPPGGAVRRH
jgi:excisionase family DNA binding protein